VRIAIKRARVVERGVLLLGGRFCEPLDLVQGQGSAAASEHRAAEVPQ
jgi:hypothetical protein